MNKGIKRVWGISEVGFFMMSSMETMFLLFFLTDVAQLPMGIVGVITGSTAIVDAVSAVLAGIVIDKVCFKSGKYRPWLLICPPIVTLFFVLCFTKIGGDVVAGCIIGVGYVVSHFVWNICWTANRNLIPVISQDPADRAWLSSRIGVGCNVGKIMNSLLVPTVSAALLGLIGGVPAYTVVALVFCLTFVVTYYVHYFITKGCDTQTSNGKPVTFAQMGKSILTNSQLIAFLLHDAIRQIAFIGTGSLASYYCRVVLGDAKKASPLLIVFYLGAIIGGTMAPKVMKKYGTKKTNWIGMLGWLICQAATLVLPSNIICVGAMLFAGQLFFGMSYGLTSGMYSMCGIYGEYKTGEAVRGVVMAFCSLAIKLAVALRGICITAVLGYVGYTAVAEITPAMQGNIRLIFSAFPVVFIVLSLVPLAFFKLDDEKVAQMDQEIGKRV